jgi:hypothetical protein
MFSLIIIKLHVFSLVCNESITNASVDFVVDMLEFHYTLRAMCLSDYNLSDISKTKLCIAAKLYFEFYLDL